MNARALWKMRFFQKLDTLYPSGLTSGGSMCLCVVILALASNFPSFNFRNVPRSATMPNDGPTHLNTYEYRASPRFLGTEVWNRAVVPRQSTKAWNHVTVLKQWFSTYETFPNTSTNFCMGRENVPEFFQKNREQNWEIWNFTWHLFIHHFV